MSSAGLFPAMDIDAAISGAGDAETAPMLPGYGPLEWIARGGMGAVYLAHEYRGHPIDRSVNAVDVRASE